MEDKKGRAKRAVSPVVATIILLAVFIVVVGAALSFAQTELSSYYAQSDLNQAQSFASSMAQAINSVAFTFGRSISIGYGFKYAAIAYIPNALKYTITVQTTSSGTQTFYVYSGMLMVAISARFFSLGQSYQQTLYPTTYPRLVSIGGGGSYTLAYSKEYFSSGQPYIYTVIVPIPLALNITQGGQTTQYVAKIYITQLVPVNQQSQPPSGCNQSQPPQLKVVKYNLTTGYVSAQGLGYASCAVSNVNSVTVSVTAINQLYPAGFFVFPQTSMSLNRPGTPWQLQLYVGVVGLGGS